MKITLAKALVVKKELTNKVQELTKRFLSSTSTNKFSALDGTPVYQDYDPESVKQELIETTSKLIAIKVLIAQANVPILTQMFQLSEVKAWCKQLQSLIVRPNTREMQLIPGTTNHQYVEIPVHNYWTTPQKNQKIEELRKQISILQDELNTYNYQTTIELPFDI